MKDPYDILGVARTASADDIKKAYRRLARELHPDNNQGTSRAEERFKDLSVAYDLLSDATKRGRYDRGEIDAHGHPATRRGPFASGAGRRPRSRSAFEEFFKRRDARQNANVTIDGSNVSYSLKVAFLEAAKGANKHVTMTNGKRLAVTIPPGTRSGQVLRLKGQGMDGIGGGKDGAALVEILVEPDPLFVLDGDDIHLEFPVSLPEAILGARLEVPTIHGAVHLTVPEGSNSGTRLRLKGKGIDNPKTKVRGNQYVTLKVVLPKKIDKELTEFIREWSGDNDYDVRGVGLKPKAEHDGKRRDAD